MQHEPIVFVIFLIFTGASVLATVALYLRQALLVAYILLGMIAGPWGAGWVEDAALISSIAHIGIIFLLFLLGLDLRPSELLGMLRKAMKLTLLSSVAFFVFGLLVAGFAGLPMLEAVIVASLMIFSSTILGLKLLPTTVLHHQRMGEVIIAILLLQDLIAILMLLVLESLQGGAALDRDLALVLLGVPGLWVLAVLLERHLLFRLFQRFDSIQEYIFLVTIGWCLGMAELAAALNMSQEIGAFIGGVALANSPISEYIADRLKPVRDFFLVMFFFSLGAGFDLRILPEVWFWALLLAGGLFFLKPAVFRWLLQGSGESDRLCWEMGFRLGQISEFSLLVAVLALQSRLISSQAAYLVQAAVLFSMIASSYWIVVRYPTPIAVSDRLRRD